MGAEHRFPGGDGVRGTETRAGYTSRGPTTEGSLTHSPSNRRKAAPFRKISHAYYLVQDIPDN